MANITKFFGKVPSKSVKGLPPGDKREVLTASCADSTGKVWPKGTEFVAQAGGYDNAANSAYVAAVMLGSRWEALQEANCDPESRARPLCEPGCKVIGGHKLCET